MSGDILRRAAALMRGRAEAAAIMAPPPWWAKGVWYHHYPVVDGAPDEVEAHPWPAIGYGHTGADVVGHTVRQELSDHIASWHPDVASEVADWLDHEADRADLPAYRDDEMRPSHPALKVARAYLDSEPTS